MLSVAIIYFYYWCFVSSNNQISVHDVSGL
jgi:hypothetical protein